MYKVHVNIPMPTLSFGWILIYRIWDFVYNSINELYTIMTVASSCRIAYSGILSHRKGNEEKKLQYISK